MTRFEELQGKVLARVQQNGDDELLFESQAGQTWKMSHSQDWCENVTIESITGDLADLIDTPILLAEEACSSADPPGYKHEYEPESQTWTFYKLRTIKGSVDIRWHGTSNGYYSERVEFKETTEWEPLERVPLPVFLEQEAKGRMKMIDNKVHRLKGIK